MCVDSEEEREGQRGEEGARENEKETGGRWRERMKGENQNGRLESKTEGRVLKGWG